MKLHQTLLLTALLYLAGTSYTWSANYTYDYFSSKGCESQGCWFKVITREDRGGLNCRARPSLQSSVRKIVRYGNRVLAKDWEISNRGYTFFKLNRGCYIRATNNRLRFFKRTGERYKGSNYTYDTPQYKDYKVYKIYKGKNHSLRMDYFGKMYKTRLRYAIKHGKPNFAGKYIVTGWGCGTSGCNTGAVINAKTGKATPWPIELSSVYPLKPEFEQEDGQEHLYKLNSRLMIFAGNLNGAAAGSGDDSVEFYEFKNGKFIFLKSKSYGKQGRY
jgi:hypothetical protein